MSRLFQFCLSGCLAVVLTSAQPKNFRAASGSDETSFARPILGFVFDRAGRQIRPLSGTPGAAVVSGGVSLGIEPDNALVSSAGAFALLSVPDSETLHFVRWLDGDSVVSQIPGTLKRFDIGALSHSAKSAILYSADCRCVQILTDLPQSPRVERTLTLAQDETVQSLSVTEDAAVFAVGQGTGEETQSGNRLRVYVAGEDEPRTVLSVSASALAFSPDGQSLAITDITRRSLSIVSDVRGAAELTEVVAERDGLAKPIALAFAPASRIVVADPDTGIQMVDTGTKRITGVECSCRPSMLERTASADIFRVTDVQSGALWMLQVGDDTVGAFFVPVRRDEPKQASEGGR
jgi:hypothetical protein